MLIQAVQYQIEKPQKKQMKKEPEISFHERPTRRKFRTVGKHSEEKHQRFLQSQHLQKSTQFMEIVRKQQCRRLNHELMEFHRRNFINKNQESNIFKEQWENKKTVEERNDLQIITYQNNPEILLAAATMICFSLTIWLANVEFFFGFNKHSFLPSLIYLIPFTFVVIDFISMGELNVIMARRTLKTAFLKLSKPVLCLFFLILKTISVEISQDPEWLLLQLPCFYILINRASQFYKSFRVMSLSKKYEYHFKAFDLIFSLMLVAHIVAIILFQVALNGPRINWMSQLGIEGENALIQYIYSFYFGCTTILTVGYGDITPKNSIQIAVVCFVQLFGIAIFAYLISEIGYNLGNLRKDREIVEKDLSMLEKCREYYKIEPELIVKARSNLLNNKEAINRLKPEEEKLLIMKLGEPLRQEILTHNSLSVLKSCIFFLCRWSKQLQRTLSQSLVAALYTPGEQLFQPSGNERIFIIRLGKIDFYRKQRGNKQQAQKMIKSLKVELNTEVCNNSFGYTAVIGSKPTVLEVISRDFTSAYYIDKDKFFRCVNETPTDFEYYHEIKDKIEQSRLPEALEVPALNSRRFHYNPPRSCVIKRQNKSIRYLKNQRIYFQRLGRQKNGKKQMVQSKLFNQKEVAQVRQAFLNSMEEITLRDQEDHKSRPSIQFSVDQKIVGNTVIQVGQVLAEVGTLKCLTTGDSIGFKQAGKEYQNYYPYQNLQTVLQRYDRNIPMKGKRFISKLSRYTEAMTLVQTTSF